MTEIEKILDIARAEIGVAEDPIGSNKTKYGIMYGRNGVEWCVIFVWCCFFLAGLSRLFYDGKKTASSTTLMNWARSKGQFMTGGYQAGDVFCYQFDSDEKAEHVGIYTGEKDDKGRYLVIEGNHNNRVELVARTDSVLWGAFRPAWEDDKKTEDVGTDCHVADAAASAPRNDGGDGVASSNTEGLDLPEIRYGDMSATVKAMQILLVGYGYKLPRYGADGDYGSETRTALKAFQKAKGLTADGICGTNTWKALLGL